MARREPITELVIPIQAGDTVRNIELSARPTFSKSGRFTGYHGVGSDVTEARQAADRIAHMARHDALTGLPNRLQLLENLDAALASARRARGEECAVLLVDLDRFKTINDSPRPCRRRPSAPAGLALLRDGDLRRDDRRAARRRRVRHRRADGREPRASSSNCASPWSARCRGPSSIASKGCSSAPASASRSARATARRSRR